MGTILDRPTDSPVSQPASTAVAPRIETEYERKLKTPNVNGPAMAALVAAGIGSFALGVFVVLTEGIPAVKTFMNLYNPVGPLAGKTTYAVVAYVVSWGVLAYLWKGREINFGKVYTATLILIALGLVGSFPLFFEVFTAR